MRARKKYQDLTEEQRERMREATRRWRRKNDEKSRESRLRWYRSNREKRLEQMRKWREENLERKRQIMRESAQRRRDEHPEITRAIQRKVRENESLERRANRLKKIREWHEAHRTEMLEWWQSYRRQPHYLEKERVRTANRNAWYRQAIGKFSAKDIADLYEKQNGKCAMCGFVFPETGTHRFQIDHIIPLKPKGASKPVGTNNPDNLQLLCQKCNRQKSNHL